MAIFGTAAAATVLAIVSIFGLGVSYMYAGTVISSQGRARAVPLIVLVATLFVVTTVIVLAAAILEGPHPMTITGN